MAVLLSRSKNHIGVYEGIGLIILIHYNRGYMKYLGILFGRHPISFRGGMHDEDVSGYSSSCIVCVFYGCLITGYGNPVRK